MRYLVAEFCAVDLNQGGISGVEWLPDEPFTDPLARLVQLLVDTHLHVGQMEVDMVFEGFFRELPDGFGSALSEEDRLTAITEILDADWPASPPLARFTVPGSPSPEVTDHTELLNRLVEPFDERLWDGEESIDATALNIARHYGALDRLIAERLSEGDGIDRLYVTYDMEKREWSLPIDDEDEIPDVTFATATPEPSTTPISATVYRVGTNMGDHAETVPRAIEVDDDETIRTLLDRIMPPPGQYDPRSRYDDFIRLSFAQPREETVSPF